MSFFREAAINTVNSQSHICVFCVAEFHMNVLLCLQILYGSFAEMIYMQQFIQRFLFGLVLIILVTSCKKQPPVVTEQTKAFAVSNFQKVRAGGSMEITVTKGANFSVRAIGRPADVQDLVIAQLNGELSVGYVNPQNRAKLQLQITMPSLEAFAFYNKSVFNVSGFNEQVMVVGVVDAETTGTLQLQAPSLKLDLQKQSAITVTGNIDNLDILANDNVTVNTYGVHAQFVRAIIMKQSTARVYVTNVLNASAVDRSRIFYKGNPLNQFTSEIDNSTIGEE